MYEWPALLVPAGKFLIERGRFRFANTGNHLDAGLAEIAKTLPRNERIRIFDRANDACDATRYESLCARRCLPVVRMRFERNVGRRPSCTLSCSLKGKYFSVGDAVVCIKTFANDRVARDDHAADGRIRAHEADTASGQRQRPLGIFRILVSRS